MHAATIRVTSSCFLVLNSAVNFSLLQWAAVRDYLGERCSEPVVLNRPPSPNATNPFDATLLCGLKHVIVEVRHLCCSDAIDAHLSASRV